MYNVEDEQKIYICILFFFSKKSYHRTSDRISIHDARITCNEVNVRGGGAGEKYATNVYVRRPLARR